MAVESDGGAADAAAVEGREMVGKGRVLWEERAGAGGRPLPAAALLPLGVVVVPVAVARPAPKPLLLVVVLLLMNLKLLPQLLLASVIILSWDRCCASGIMSGLVMTPMERRPSGSTSRAKRRMICVRVPGRASGERVCRRTCHAGAKRAHGPGQGSRDACCRHERGSQGRGERGQDRAFRHKDRITRVRQRLGGVRAQASSACRSTHCSVSRHGAP